MYLDTPRFPFLSTVVVSLAVVQSSALQVDPTNVDSIKSAAKSIASDMMAYYIGDQPGKVPGYLPGNVTDPSHGYYWWEGGGMFGAMINYWYHTGDATWVDATGQAIWFQADPGSGGYFSNKNISGQLGNDDQAFWAFAAMTAAEYRFPNPPAGNPSWLGMAQAVYNQQIQRWDNTSCGGGLKWQVGGGPYKNSISNGCFFQLAARVGKYTGNSTQIDAANMAWDWSVAAGLIQFYPGSTTTYKVIDGIYITNCQPDGGNSLTQWTYNVGVYLYGAATMWNITQSNPAYASQAGVWQQRATAMLNGMKVFLQNDTQTQGLGVLTEVVCELGGTCKNDAKSFKSYAIQWMRVSAIVAPFLADEVSSILAPSIQAAATACTGPGQAGGVACGLRWYVGGYDETTGIGQQMNALEIMQTLIPTYGPVTAAQGNSSSDPSAGTNSGLYDPNTKIDSGIIRVTTADRVGAWIIFTLLAGGTLGGSAWACM